MSDPNTNARRLQEGIISTIGLVAGVQSGNAYLAATSALKLTGMMYEKGVEHGIFPSLNDDPGAKRGPRV